MRLIDANEMLENLTEAYINAQPNCDALTAVVNTVVHEKITRLINDTPTAYDIDKVVEQIQDIKKVEKECRWECENYDWDYGCCEGECDDYIKNKAIEIVKGACDGQNIT